MSEAVERVMALADKAKFSFIHGTDAEQERDDAALRAAVEALAQRVQPEQPNSMKDHLAAPLAAGTAGSVAPPMTPREVRDFVGVDFCSLEYGAEDQVPHEDDTYTMTAHDLISALTKWYERAPAPSACTAPAAPDPDGLASASSPIPAPSDPMQGAFDTALAIADRAMGTAPAKEPAQPVACNHEPWLGRCVHCDMRFVNGRAVSAPDGVDALADMVARITPENRHGPALEDGDGVDALLRECEKVLTDAAGLIKTLGGNPKMQLRTLAKLRERLGEKA